MNSTTEARLVRATELAWRWHGDQTRKGKSTCYVSHLLQVQGLVLDNEGDDDSAIAALLHDGLEDSDNPEERSARESTIQTDFGSAVLRIVLDCTDTLASEAGTSKGPWRERKERYLEQLACAGAASHLVAACDKRHNLGDLISDLRHEGTGTLDRFNASGLDQIWYFDSVVQACRESIPVRLASELDTLLDELRDFVDRDRSTERHS
ncbi:MAG: HD domain-containing protein [Myxococcales bacterium]|nr:HD domain-containing protein [Myxococcales bacterium]HIK85743.1 HD domain-containing protein [Myxococcales bacterium]